MWVGVRDGAGWYVLLAFLLLLLLMLLLLSSMPVFCDIASPRPTR